MVWMLTTSELQYPGPCFVKKKKISQKLILWKNVEHLECSEWHYSQQTANLILPPQSNGRKYLGQLRGLISRPAICCASKFPGKQVEECGRVIPQLRFVKDN